MNSSCIIFFFTFVLVCLVKMVKTKELSNSERGRVIGLFEAGYSERAISEKTGYGKTTIHNIITKYRNTGTLTVALRSGRPKKLNERDKRHLKIIVNQNRCDSAEKIKKDFIESSGKKVSKSTIKRTLYEMEYHSRTALR